MTIRSLLALHATFFMAVGTALAATTTYRTLVLGDNPIVYYEFDETSGTTAFNSAATGTLYDGTFNTAGGSITVNQPSFAQGGTAYDFGGGFVGAASALTSSLDEWTVEAWVNYDAAKTGASNFLSNDQGGWNDDVLFGIGAETGSAGVPAGHVGLIQQGHPGTTRDAAGAPLAANEWHHVVVTGSTSAGALTLYIDGVFAASDTSLVNGITFNGADGFGTANLTIGAARPNSGDAGYRPYDGLLDEVAIYDSVLDAVTIASHFYAAASTPGTPPVIVRQSPLDGADGVTPSVDPMATFSEPMVLTGSGTVTIRNLTLGPGADLTIPLPDSGVMVSGATLTIDPATNFSVNTSYAIRISSNALQDVSGDPFAGISTDADWNFTTAAEDPGGGGPSRFGLTVTNYAPGSDSVRFRWPTHIAFGPGQQEIVTDLKNNRLVYRNDPGDAFTVSPVQLNGAHSVVYNPADGLYYADDTENNRLVAFADLSSGTIAAETNKVAGVTLSRPHDVVIDPATGWIYALNPNSGHVFRFTAIGENESAIQVPVGGYARALTFTNGKLYAIGSAKGRIVEIVDWDTSSFNIYDSFDPSGGDGPAGSWTRTGLVLNDAEYFEGFWYATSYFTRSYAGGTDYNEHKFIRFETFDDLVAGEWTDLSNLVPDGMTPYFLTAHGETLNLAIFNHESPGNGDGILQFTTARFSIPGIVHDSLTASTTLTWQSNEGEVFDVYKCVDLSAGSNAWTLIKSGIPAAAAPARVTTVLVDTHALDARSYYRIVRTNDGE